MLAGYSGGAVDSAITKITTVFQAFPGFVLAVAIAGSTAAIAQGKVCASAVVMVGKRDDAIGRAITMAVFTELFALFGLIISILCVLLIPATAAL